MTGPDRIWAWPTLTTALTSIHADDEDLDTYGLIEYIRSDPAVLAALPEVQALIRQAVEAERKRIIAGLRDEADVIPCSEDAMVTEGCADLIEADFSHDDAERIAAIRKRGEG